MFVVAYYQQDIPLFQMNVYEIPRIFRQLLLVRHKQVGIPVGKRKMIGSWILAMPDLLNCCRQAGQHLQYTSVVRHWLNIGWSYEPDTQPSPVLAYKRYYRHWRIAQMFQDLMSLEYKLALELVCCILRTYLMACNLDSCLVFRKQYTEKPDHQTNKLVLVVLPKMLVSQKMQHSLISICMRYWHPQTELGRYTVHG
uniref:(northern house mosquito) hypothetical protein n=1 Tax=Culex pipiens TaxID=7175 RepID=A0A8D8G2P9_CULPI